MCTLSVSNVIYHKFSHGAAFYTLNGKNVNVMLEFHIKYYVILFSCFDALRPQRTVMVMSGRLVNLTTLFLDRLRPPKRLTNTKCSYVCQ